MNQADRTDPEPLDPKGVARAARRSIHSMVAQQHDGGYYQWDTVVGPPSTALTHLVLDHLGYAPDGDAPKVAAFLAAHQLPDGSFAANNDDRAGDAAATAACGACLQTCGRPEDAKAIQRAETWLDAHGGLAGVAQQLTPAALIDNTTDPYMTGALLAFTGHLDRALLPDLPLDYTAIPGIDRVVDKLVNLGVLFSEQTAAALVATLKGKHFGGLLHGIEVGHIESLALQFQNPNGSWNDTVAQTLVPMAAFIAMGKAKDDPIVARAAHWIVNANRRHTDQWVWYRQFGNSVWDTAIVLRALLANGVPAGHPSIDAAVAWFHHVQLHERSPEPLNPSSGIDAGGGLGFEGTNKLLPDADDTGLGLGGLGLYLERAGVENIDPKLAGALSDAIAKNLEWLQNMQNDDGGWGSYSKNLPGKPRGSFAVRAPLDILHPLRSLKSAKQVLDSVGDPSTAGLTGRVLTGLGRNGFDLESPTVARAIAYLFDQQLPDGSWWGRWMANYLAGTSWVLLGCAAVGQPFDDPRIRRAIELLVSHQNDDGGWGESVESYVDPTLVGQGPSMPGLTGTVATALLLGGQLDDPGVAPVIERAIGYLLQTQSSDGTWPGNGWMHVYLLPRYFYELPAETLCLPLEALGRYLQARGHALPLAGGITVESKARADAPERPAPDAPVRQPSGAWSQHGLNARRAQADPEADTLVQSLFASGQDQIASAAFRELIKSDDPIPAGLDPALRAWFDTAHALPAWADPKKIARAQRLFTRHGWATAFGLFCSSLPQAYAAANGARVLMGTQGMTRHVHRRVLETAQMVFDVLDPDGFGPNGRGIRACQKVRLMHAAIRHLLLEQGQWNTEAWGMPINQQDLAGTLMTFSSVILDVFGLLGLEVDDADQEAWIHHWRCVGHMMGLRPEMMPRDREDAEALMNVIRVDQWAWSPHGERLIRHLVDAIVEAMPVPGAEKLAVAMIRAAAGDWCSRTLKLPEVTWSQALIHGGFELEALLHRGSGHSERVDLLNTLGRRLMQGVISAQRLGKQTAFRIPPALHRAWTLDD